MLEKSVNFAKTENNIVSRIFQKMKIQNEPTHTVLIDLVDEIIISSI